MIKHEDIGRLSTAERLSLIGELWDSIADSDAPLTLAQGDELERRLAVFDDEKAQAVGWDALKRELGARKL
jgi:putative addiction module component (TIGR02574 family)